MKTFIIITFIAFAIVAAGIGAYFIFQKSAFPNPLSDKCGDGICDAHEQANKNLCPKDCIAALNQSTSQSGIGDNLIIGTEDLALYFNNEREIQETSNVINNVLKTKHVKVRFDQFTMNKDENGNFLPYFCALDPKTNRKDCSKDRFSIDKIADVFIKNGWDMYPMFSQQNQFLTNRRELNDEIINEYVEWIEWFLDRYSSKLNIPFIEPGNNPANNWKLGKATTAQLVEQQNKVYERIKEKYPNLTITSPGFEFFGDGFDFFSDGEDFVNKLVLYFLDSKNGAKYDAFAFHAYPVQYLHLNARQQLLSQGLSYEEIEELKENLSFYPPTKKAIYNKYAGNAGMLEIRKALDKTGWADREIFVTEEWLILPENKRNIVYTESQDDLLAAVNTQDFLIKKTLTHNGKSVLSVINKMYIGRRGIMPLKRQGSLMPDGTVSKHVKSMGFLWQKLAEYSYDSRLSGEFDNENETWVEKFKGENKEMYIFFKPFEFIEYKPLQFDNKTSEYELRLEKEPVQATLYDMHGEIQKIPLGKGRTIKLQAQNSPQYLEVSYGQKD